MEKQTIIDNLRAFVAQRPGFDLCNYGSLSSYRADYDPVRKDKEAFLAMVRYCELFSVDLLKYASENQNGRLQIDIDTGRVSYCTGQYFPTEYRAAACRFLAGAIWDYWRSECELDTWQKIYRHARNEFGKRTADRFFN